MATTFPLPGGGRAAVAVPAPGAGFGNWAGAPSAALDADGTLLVAYRLRMVGSRGAEVVVARSEDGERLTTLCRLGRERFGAESLERPAIVRSSEGRWRLYVCCATPRSKHWWVDLLEADDPARLAEAPARTVFPGDERLGVKDPVFRRRGDGWQAWICCHPLEQAGDEDRMTTAYATSDDGVAWRWHGTVLAGRPGLWDARGARVTAVLPDGRASYDGRASKDENFRERTGIAEPGDGARLRAVGAEPAAAVRYLEVVPLPGGGCRLYYEAPLPDESHELRTELVEGGPTSR